MAYAAITEFMDAKERAAFDMKLKTPPLVAARAKNSRAQPHTTAALGTDVRQLMGIMTNVPQKVKKTKAMTKE